MVRDNVKEDILHLVGTLKIDGVLHEVRLYPLSEKPAETNGAPALSVPRLEPAADSGVALPRNVTLIKASTIQGVSKTTAKPYTIYKYSGNDGLEYSTFKHDLSLLLKLNEPMRLFCNPDKMGRGFSILSIAEPERRVV